MTTHMHLLAIDRIVNDRFNNGQDARSTQYRDGFRAGLESGAGFQTKQNPYIAGSTLSDAWYSGHEHGLRAWHLQALRADHLTDSVASSIPASGRVFLGGAA